MSCLKQNSTLQKLDLESKVCQSWILQHRFCAKHTKIYKLAPMKFAMMSFIVAQGITADGAQSIADALYLHPSVTELILAQNVLADQGTPSKL